MIPGSPKGKRNRNWEINHGYSKLGTGTSQEVSSSLTHSNTTKCANRVHTQPGMKIVRTELRKGRNVFLWQGRAYLNPKGVCEGHQSFLTTKRQHTTAIPTEYWGLGCPKPHHCNSLSQYELHLGKSAFCSDVQLCTAVQRIPQLCMKYA